MTERVTGAGVGIYSNQFLSYKGVGRDTTNFDGEVKAIFFALNQLSSRKSSFPGVVILPDSKAALQVISSMFALPNEFTNIERFSIQILADSIVLQWIPAPCGIEGNERADFLAKKGTTYKPLITI
ncbi:uncharacterized protein LOC118186029 [Stegodyphus dumicola]|uniref:uncharacterized protein LOC118186029 n=1 Tax=Stegodyphus dumicola TaxID=202533 RepID=UPI0015B1F753|nr:uncharacterized protein LOC118186029 [Stegodyphus dumicola]